MKRLKIFIFTIFSLILLGNIASIAEHKNETDNLFTYEKKHCDVMGFQDGTQQFKLCVLKLHVSVSSEKRAPSELVTFSKCALESDDYIFDNNKYDINGAEISIENNTVKLYKVYKQEYIRKLNKKNSSRYYSMYAELTFVNEYFAVKEELNLLLGKKGKSTKIVYNLHEKTIEERSFNEKTNDFVIINSKCE